MGIRDKRIEDYSKNPSVCKQCNSPLSYEKKKNQFCNHSCSASFNNIGFKRNITSGKWMKKPCLNCGKLHNNANYCSQKCHRKYDRKKRIELIKNNNCLINYQKDKWYLIETRGHACEKCNNSEWNEENIPLDMHHKDGNSDNNCLDNVQLLCPNCHRQTPNHGNKNKAASKRSAYRKKRYDHGLSF